MFVANALQVSKRTVDTNRERIMRKIGATSLMGLLRYAIKKELFQTQANGM